MKDVKKRGDAKSISLEFRRAFESQLHLEARLILRMTSICAIVQRLLNRFQNKLFANDYIVMETIPLMLIGVDFLFLEV